MSVQAMTWALDHSQAKGSTLLVLISIANHCGKYGDEAWPSHPTIAAEARVSRNTAIKAIDELEALGEVVVYVGQGRTGKGGTTNLYGMPLVPGWASPSDLVPRKQCNPDTSSEAARSGEPKPRDSEYKPRDPATKDVSPAAREPSIEPSIEPSSKEPSARFALDASFDAWWLTYPARNGKTRGDKPRARLLWGKLSDEDRAKVVRATPNYAAATDPQFVKNAEGWLRARYFDDWQEPGKPRAKNGPPRAGQWSEAQQSGPVRLGVWSDD